MSPTSSNTVALRVENAIVEGLLQVVIEVLLDQILQRKEFPGFGLFLKVPPGFQEHQAYFESYVLRHAMSTLGNNLRLQQKLLCEPRILTNVSRYVLHMAEAIFEGWFLNGAEPLLDFIGSMLEYLERPDIAKIKNVRLCSQAVATLKETFFRIALLRLSELDQNEDEHDSVVFLDKLSYWQTIIVSPDNTENNYLVLVCYLLYTKLISKQESIRLASANLWRMLLVQKPSEASLMFSHPSGSNYKNLSAGFMKLLELDNEAFLAWVDDHRDRLDSMFFSNLSSGWDDFVAEENRKTEDSAKYRVSRRRERLRQWQVKENSAEDIWRRHETATNHWRHNVHAAERLKHQRSLQDQQDNLAFTSSTLQRLDRLLRGPCGLFENDENAKWRLDETEGWNRMRLRTTPDRTIHQDEYQPKRKTSDMGPKVKPKPKLDTAVKIISSKEIVGASPAVANGPLEAIEFPAARQRSTSQSSAVSATLEDDFEIVEDPKEDEDGFEDKNRKVMRTLQHGDQIQHVCNVSRIVGLEACEGLLILGKDSLYLLDNYFQRADGEVVGVWQAPPEERDPYLQMISGRETNNRKSRADISEETSRHWPWSEVIIISKRRFLFRDVAIEIFFNDGRSYLLTAISVQIRNDLFTRLMARAPHANSPTSSLTSEDSWRLEALRNPEEAPQTFGSKFANVFNTTSSNPATRRWMKGDMSNFAYLMLINTMAGRTFNDLTQYPVFPWVLADYKSEELDLTDPRTFRDLSKPMGCQTPAREAEFRERYHTFAEMSDHSTPAFHYGTHYSSAMIVSSYLIRLQPFVQSYLLLQGGSFDHADRLFYSIEKAWISASRDNMTDVRELTPEFFYLPEFLTNVNGYNFGLKQNSGEKIDDVILPPWAKGDPHVFIAKHREALESPYVTMHLHKWIDLVFGFKQRGEAAIEATNVFHHLSYHGAKDLDTIEDSIEKLATIGIIHNFGQTPHQVFQRAHVQREDTSNRYKRLDNSAESLARLPLALLEGHERVSSLMYSSKQERLLCSGAFRLNIPPAYERYMEWGFADGSVRFYAADSRKLVGLFEHLHQGQLSCATFADSKTLVTAGTDSVITVWNVVSSSKLVDLQPKVNLFGHRAPITILATCNAFGVFISASSDGRVLLWDLNRSEFLRELSCAQEPVRCACINKTNGNIMVCSGQRLLLYTINGHLLLERNVCDTDHEEDIITSCAFYEGVGSEWLERELLFTGHRRGVVNIWRISITSQSKWTLEPVKRLNHVDRSREDGLNFAAPITCILPMPQVVYTGDDDGRVYEWDCVKQT